MENNDTTQSIQEVIKEPIENKAEETVEENVLAVEKSDLLIKKDEIAAMPDEKCKDKCKVDVQKEKSPTPQRDTVGESQTPVLKESGNVAPPVLGKIHKLARGKREDKEMRREVRFLEELQKKIGGPSNDQQMFLSVIKKYQSMYDELKKNEATVADWQASYLTVKRERDSLNSENQRLLMRVGKTEALCRLQQQQNKQTKEEYINKLREEQEKRKEVTGKLHETLKQLDVVLNENSVRSNKLHEENIDMSQKLARLHQQINKRSEETRTAEKQLELQKQLYNTEISKNRLEHEAEKEVYLRQVELLQYQLQEKETEIKIQKTELATMESRVDEYIKKYADIEPFISQSSKLFETYKGKIETMNATNSSLEAEVFDWQKKYNECMRNVVDLTIILKSKEKDVAQLQRKLDRLQNLCRQLQTDRSNFLKQLKAAGIEPGDENDKQPSIESSDAICTTSPSSADDVSNCNVICDENTVSSSNLPNDLALENNTEKQTTTNQSNDLALENNSVKQTTTNQSNDVALENNSEIKTTTNQSNDMALENNSEKQTITNQSNDLTLDNISEKQTTTNEELGEKHICSNNTKSEEDNIEQSTTN